MATARNVIKAARGLRRTADSRGFEGEQADGIGIAAARIAAASADRLLIRPGAWMLAVIAIATTIIVASPRLSLARRRPSCRIGGRAEATRSRAAVSGGPLHKYWRAACLAAGLTVPGDPV